MGLKKVTGVIAAATGLVFTTIGATPAAAVTSPVGCPRGYFCLGGDPSHGYNNPTFKTAGNWSGSVYTSSYFNNGYPSPGADHVQMTWYVADGGAGPFSDCIHYNPGPGDYAATFGGDHIRVVRIQWRGEC